MGQKGAPAQRLGGVKLRDAKIVRVQPGDVIVIRSKEKLSQDRLVKLNEAAQGAFPGNRVVVMDEDLDVCSIREEDLRAEEAAELVDDMEPS